MNEIAEKIYADGKHSVEMCPGLAELFIFNFADDLILLLSTPIGHQN